MSDNPVATPLNTVALEARVQSVINAINANEVIPYGDYGGTTVYYFQTFENNLGNLVYTIFDRVSTLALSSYMVRFSAGSTIRQVLFSQYPKSEIPLQFLVLPHIPTPTITGGSVSP